MYLIEDSNSINDIFLYISKFFKVHLYLLFIKNIANKKIPNDKESAAKSLLELIIKQFISIADEKVAIGCQNLHSLSRLGHGQKYIAAKKR